jgi:peptide/nickel transport system substrate-binding protein
VRQIAQNITTEGLGRVAEDGRLEPQFASQWALSDGGRTLRINLKPGLQFQDGSPANGGAVAHLLPAAFHNLAGSLADDVDAIVAPDATTVDIRYRRSSPFLLELLEVPIRTTGPHGVSTGPFMAAERDDEWLANPNYHLGRPAIDRVTIQTFPSVRSAWAELLRSNIDMLYEVGADALDSLENATNVEVFTFTRRYQYTVVLNTASSALKSKAIRQAMSLAIDRVQLVQRALNGHGLPSTGPIWPKHWALADKSVRSHFDPGRAAEQLHRSASIRFVCLMPSDPIYERIGLELKRQLALVGIDVDLKALPPDELLRAEGSREYDAVLTEMISGPTLLRLYLMWHSGGPMNSTNARGNATIDAALDRVRNATTEDEYRDAVPRVQAAFEDDPGALFLAWSERARAVSRRFTVPAPEPGADVLRTLRLWAPRNDERFANRN